METMKTYQKIIFDLDYTLLIPDWSQEANYLKKHIPESEQEEFFKQYQGILDEYQLKEPKYDCKTLSETFRKHGFTVTEEVIYGWMIHNGETIIDEVVDGVIELFDYLKEKGIEIVILTSWFGATQIPRLKRAGLYSYISKVVSGDDAMKPDLESFLLAIGDTPKDECLMVGDSLESDKKGADRAGIECYLLDKEHTIRKLYQMMAASDKEKKQLGKKKNEVFLPSTMKGDETNGK